jgi:hypothetical protein
VKLWLNRLRAGAQPAQKSRNVQQMGGLFRCLRTHLCFAKRRSETGPTRAGEFAVLEPAAFARHSERFMRRGSLALLQESTRKKAAPDQARWDLERSGSRLPVSSPPRFLTR